MKIKRMIGKLNGQWKINRDNEIQNLKIIIKKTHTQNVDRMNDIQQALGHDQVFNMLNMFNISF